MSLAVAFTTLKVEFANFKLNKESLKYDGSTYIQFNLAILKDEFYLDQFFTNVAHAKRAAKNVIKLYNKIRLHLSLDYKTPNPGI